MNLVNSPAQETELESIERETVDDRWAPSNRTADEIAAAKPSESNSAKPPQSQGPHNSENKESLGASSAFVSGREEPTQGNALPSSDFLPGLAQVKKIDLASAGEDELYQLIPSSLHERFEDFKLLGKGGMGVVFKARDLRLGRQVAIKLLLTPGAYLGDDFLREAQAQARLKHDNACEVYEAGVADRVVPFIVMRYIDGLPFHKMRQTMTLEDKVHIVAKVALALHDAHRIGLVHRDVKPSNIMVERGEDGMWKPYLMDFGLAREVGEGGNTATGTVLGTPAYMPPEQAMGDIRAMDRRSDVYSLGATLYDMIAGRPPFVSDQMWSLLMAVAYEEPPALSKLKPGVPLDLETIVSKAIEREPARRYDSAKAFAEDLQRYLDGDPIFARRSSLGYVLWKRAKKNKLMTAIAVIVTVSAIILASVWVKARRQAAEQARLAQQLGENVKEMELLMRNAHTMPLHDVAREQRLLRTRLEEIRTRMNEVGNPGIGPGQYALGRGELALQEPRKALEHLRQAEQAGYRTPGLDYALGVALSDLYAEAFEETRRIQNVEARKQRIAEIKAEYEVPAINHLRAALDGTTETRTYVEALLAFHEGRMDEALEKAQRSYSEAPWFYEAKVLEGDILFARGRPFGHDAAFNYDKMKTWFEQAARAYAIASDHGRSDTKTHAAECELWIQSMMADNARGSSMRPNFEKAEMACDKAIQAGSPNGRAYVRRAFLHNCFSWWVVANGKQEEQPELAVLEAVKQAEEALKRSQGDPMAPYVVGGVYRAQALYQRKKGADMRNALRRSIEGYQAALDLDPDFVWASSELCNVYTMKGADDARRGEDPTAALTRAVELCDRAMALDPTFLYAKNNRLSTAERLAEHLVEKGQSPDAVVQAALPVLEAARKLEPSLRTIPYVRARLELLRARHSLDTGENVAAALTRLREAAADLAPYTATWPLAADVASNLLIREGRCLLTEGETPMPALEKAREILDRLITQDASWSISHRTSRAEVELTAFEWSVHSGNPDRTRLVDALRSLQGVDDEPRNDPYLFGTLATIHYMRATLDAEKGKSAKSDILEGLRHADAALTSNPKNADALVMKGKLLLLQARLAKEGEERREIAKRAMDAFNAGLEANPLKKRSDGPLLEQAQRIVEKEPSLQDH